MTKPAAGSAKEDAAYPREVFDASCRRRPETGGLPSSAETAALLSGVLVGENEVLHGDNSLEEEVNNRAVLRLRQWHNKHGCTRVRQEDPPCKHPQHWKDVALLRGALMKLGLPGDTDMLAVPEPASEKPARAGHAPWPEVKAARKNRKEKEKEKQPEPEAAGAHHHEERNVFAMTVAQVIELAARENIPPGAVFDSADGPWDMIPGPGNEEPGKIQVPVLTWRVED